MGKLKVHKQEVALKLKSGNKFTQLQASCLSYKQNSANVSLLDMLKLKL